MYILLIQFCVVAALIQFKRLANVYFLVTAVLQFIPAISPLSPVSAIAPLIFVLTVSLIRAAVEEIGKYRYDREANSSKFLVYVSQQHKKSNSQSESNNQTNGQWRQRRSDELRIGNIIKINQNQRFPADIIILSTSNPDGKAYIETSSLDGEKNLKVRSILPSTQKMYGSLEEIAKTNIKKPFVTIEQPSEQLYSFNAMLQYTKQLQKPMYGMRNKKQQKVSEFIKINQLLYRESVLRNTQHIVGVIVYVGKFTKSMMNSTGGHDKMSKLQKKVNFYMIFIFLLQLALIVLCGVLRVFLFYNTQVSQQFAALVIRQSLRNPLLQGVLTSCSYFILLNTMIPISLLVSIEIVKFGQGIFISYDKLMSKRDEKDGKYTYSRAFRSSINEELGMVEYVFTDKTGTLTRNQMLLKQIVAGNSAYQNQPHPPLKNHKDYYSNSKLQQQSAKSVPQLLTFMKQLKQRIQSQFQPQVRGQSSSSLLDEKNQKLLNTLMLIIMSTCHQCLLEKGATEEQYQYHGSSPDEITLVDSSARCGYKFIENRYDTISVQLKDGEIVKFKVEDVFEFNSDRKRMSIILSTEYLPNYVLLFSKGADSSIDKLLRQQYKTKKGTIQYNCYNAIKQKITQNSKTGLRTLLFGYKAIPLSKYKILRQKLLQHTDVQNSKSSASAATKQQIVTAMEENLELCGTTSVEDKLQDEVEDVIEDLIKANIKVCMLTGDKLETAENIAKSCRLFRDQWKIVRIAEGSGDVDVFKGYCQIKDYIEIGEKYGILVEGSAIATAINSIYFSQMFDNCSAAVCCRITPKNKAEMVLFAKQHLNKLVLSIGDGANDVPMIQAANIGVGLYGNEGMNAVQASDFALPDFKALWRLLFVHGRWNYLRIAELVKYFFYKNMVFTLGQLWFAYLCGFSGTSIYDATYLVLYNTIFTGGPVLIRALLEQDLNYIQIIEQIKHENQLTNGKYPNKQLQRQLLIDEQVTLGVPGEAQSGTQSKSKIVNKLAIDMNLKKLFPLLYSHSQEEQALTPRLFLFLILQSIIESFCIFLTIYFGIEAPQLSIFSICLYSVILALVTIRICYDIQYWTWLMVAVLLLTSILPYLGFVYLMSVFQFALAGTFVQMFQIPDFYFCLGLALGLGSFIQGTFNIVSKYYFPTAADSVRKQWKKLSKQEQKQSQARKHERKQQHRKTIQAKYHEIVQSSRSGDKTNPDIQIQLRQIRNNRK